jgi:hypothetical protein
MKKTLSIYLCFLFFTFQLNTPNLLMAQVPYQNLPQTQTQVETQAEKYFQALTQKYKMKYVFTAVTLFSLLLANGMINNNQSSISYALAATTLLSYLIVSGVININNPFIQLRYGSDGMDLRSLVLRFGAFLQNKKSVILKSNIDECVNVLKSSNTKGNFVENLLARSAWDPILSLESSDHQIWHDLMSGFFPIFSKLRWSTVVPELMELEKEKLRKKLDENPHLVVDAPVISKMVLGIFFHLIFNREITDSEEELFYEASLEWRKEIALKGKGKAEIKQEFWNNLLVLLEQNYGDEFPKGTDNLTKQKVFASIFAQPFFISPQINFADIFASTGKILQDNPEIESQARSRKDEDSRKQYLRGILFESMRLYHPFPILERELTKDLVINGQNYPVGSQVFIMYDEFKQSQVVDPQSWVDNKNEFANLLFGSGRRSCPGKKLAEDMLIDLFDFYLELPSEKFQPQRNLLYSGRTNDKNVTLTETIFQLKGLGKFLLDCYLTRSTGNPSEI